jgi:riboflavin synthase
MFTGIIQAVGRVQSAEARGGDLRLVIDSTTLAQRVSANRLAIGESVAVNGVCLTVLEPEGGMLRFDVSRESLEKTTLGELQAGSRVNLESALCVGDPLGGHIVSGHIDGVAVVTAVAEDARSLRVELEVPAELALYVAPKGSVALDGVSLTVNAVDGRRFGINLIPHTLEATTFAALAPGRRLNFEVDTIARYVRRMLQPD